MIFDCLKNAENYYRLHPGFQAAFSYLSKTDLLALPNGRNDIDGDRLFVVMIREKGHGRAAKKLEAHQKYIDIQLTLSGIDDIGWKPTSECAQVMSKFDREKDFALYSDSSDMWLSVPPGRFVIFFPGDAHAPMGAECEIIKAVVKVSLDWLS